MFIGHFGVGMGAKKFAPRVSLGVLFIAAQFLDLLWPTLLLLDIEHVAIKTGDHYQPLEFTDYPVSHSLAMVLLWSIAFAFIYWLIKRDRRTALLLGFLVLSHWLLDLIVHLPDLPLYPGNAPKVGFGLWNYPVITAIIEGTIFITGLLFYLRKTRARNGIGRMGFWVLIVLLLASHLASIISPPPTSVSAIAWGAQLQWIFVLMAFWVDRNRIVV